MYIDASVGQITWASPPVVRSPSLSIVSCFYSRIAVARPVQNPASGCILRVRVCAVNLAHLAVSLPAARSVERNDHILNQRSCSHSHRIFPHTQVQDQGEDQVQAPSRRCL